MTRAEAYAAWQAAWLEYQKQEPPDPEAARAFREAYAAWLAAR